MASIQSKMMYYMMKYRHLMNFRLRPDTWDENTSIPAFRELCERQNARMAQLPEGVEVTPLQIGEMYAEWLAPVGAPAEQAILYTIGGGYISGSCSDHRSIVAKFAKNCGRRVLMFDHRLAPEHPYPAALEDSVAAYRWLLDEGLEPRNLMIVGESAGGGLCLATLLALRDQGYPLPSAAAALSPWTDLKLTGESYRTKAGVCISPPGMSQVCSKYYVGENDPTHPWISPLYGDLHGLPPILIQVGEYETMLDDSTRFAEKARAAGVDVRLTVGAEMVHCYPLMAPMFPEATEAMAELCGFIREHIGREALELVPAV